MTDQIPYSTPQFVRHRSEMVLMERRISSFNGYFIQLNRGDPNFVGLNAVLANVNFRGVISQFPRRSVMVRMEMISSLGEHYIQLNQGDPNFVSINGVLANITLGHLTIFQRFVDPVPEPSPSPNAALTAVESEDELIRDDHVLSSTDEEDGCPDDESGGVN